MLPRPTLIVGAGSCVSVFCGTCEPYSILNDRLMNYCSAGLYSIHVQRRGPTHYVADDVVRLQASQDWTRILELPGEGRGRSWRTTRWLKTGLLSHAQLCTHYPPSHHMSTCTIIKLLTSLIPRLHTSHIGGLGMRLVTNN